jgi:hypothetical protein
MYPDAPIVLLAPSLTARAAMRSLGSLDTPIAGAMLVLPVVDVQATIAAVGERDLLGDYRRGEIRDGECMRVVDHEISTEFARDAWDASWIGLDATSADLARCDLSQQAIVAERDEWVVAEDVINVLTQANVDVTVLEATSHDLANNLPVMREVLRLAVECTAELIGLAPDDHSLPSFDELVAIIRAERAWAKGGYADLEPIALPG